MNTPSEDYRQTTIVTPRPVPEALDAIADSVVGTYHRRSGILRKLLKKAKTIEALAPQWETVSDSALREELTRLQGIFRRGGRGAEDVLCPALAVVREAAARWVGLRAYRVQLAGALALHQGTLAEMATGEGKTLVAGLAAVLAGWTGRPCHVITVNDYLAGRDAAWLRPLYRHCGLTVGTVTSAMKPDERRAGYDADITYTTGKEMLADFLRDRIRLGQLQNANRRQIRRFAGKGRSDIPGVVMRGIHTAIVDEADSILIDEAVTPLIISQPQPNTLLIDATKTANELVEALEPAVDYRVDEGYREVQLTPRGLERAATRMPMLHGLWQSPRRWAGLVEQALTARVFFQRDQQYVVQDDEVVIVDEFTGRMMPQRTWRHGLHQAIQAKEGIEVGQASETLARLSFQRFFRFFVKLSGMTGTAHEARRELWRVYHLPVVRIPTHKRCQRRHAGDRLFASERKKWEAVAAEIEALHAAQRPVLVGTRSVAASETLAGMLREKGLPFELLNAVHHREEARVVAEAGKPGQITIATNMAGRGTDILLGDGVPEAGGLHVIATERHESRRIDRQLFGRCARQGDPGCAQAFLSLEDELFRRFLPGHRWIAPLVSVLARGRTGTGLFSGILVRASQFVAQRRAAAQRRSVLRMDTWVDDALSFAGGSDRVG